jgi:hypothetical protein
MRFRTAPFRLLLSAPTRPLLRALLASGAALTMVALLPEAAAACPVCFDAREENRQAFLATTAFLSLLPLGMVAGAGLWIRKRNRELDELHDDSGPSDPGRDD